MKHFTLLFILISMFGFKSFGQPNKSNLKPSKKETQTWISNNIASHPFISDGGDIKHDYGISFDEISLIFRDVFYINGKTRNYETKFNVSDIDSVFWEDKKFNVWFTIVLKPEKKEIVFCGDEKRPSEGKIEILLSKTFLENDLPNRMVKAFNRLVETYNVKGKDTF